jgi:glycosyltransferase involved in cell wall biosynthesis
MCWQRHALSGLAQRRGCDVLLVPGGAYAGVFRPFVTVSQNLLPFEWSELRRFGCSAMTLKMLALRRVQSRTFRQADGVIFLSKYAEDRVTQVIDWLTGERKIVPHGIEKRFFCEPRPPRMPDSFCMSDPFRIEYVSTIDVYKHQWRVAEAVAILREKGIPVEVNFVGQAYGPALKRLNSEIKKHDRRGEFLTYEGAVAFKKLHEVYKRADLFIFASSCENLPNILLEAMASGLAIACSNRGPMPELLGCDGAYFDPENAAEIAAVIMTLFDQPELRNRLAWGAYRRAQSYSWRQCADETFSFVSAIARKYKQSSSRG